MDEQEDLRPDKVFLELTSKVLYHGRTHLADETVSYKCGGNICKAHIKQRMGISKLNNTKANNASTK